jgi:predicted PurR-regulated permease PerM
VEGDGAPDQTPDQASETASASAGPPPSEAVPAAEAPAEPQGRPPAPERRRSQPAGRPRRSLGRSFRQKPASSGPTFTVDFVVRFLIGAAVAAGVAWGLWYFASLVAYLVVGGVLAYVLRPIVDRVQGLGVGRVPAILVTFVVVVTVIAMLATSIVPFVTQQVRDLSQLVSVEAATDAATYIEDRFRGVFPMEEGVLVKQVRQAATSLVEGDLVEGERVASTVSSVVAVFTNIVYAVVIIPFITFFFLKDGMRIRRSLLGLVPNRYFEVTVAILDKVEVNIGRYFQALFVQCTSIALIASALLWLVGLQYPVAIGIFTGLANTIPYFGPFLGFLGGALVGIAQTGSLGLVPGVAMAMGLTQLADNVLLQPIIFSRAAQAHPLVILFVVLIGAQLAGIVGMLVAIPLTTTLRVIAQQVLWSIRNYRILRSG